MIKGGPVKKVTKLDFQKKVISWPKIGQIGPNLPKLLGSILLFESSDFSDFAICDRYTLYLTDGNGLVAERILLKNLALIFDLSPNHFCLQMHFFDC